MNFILRTVTSGNIEINDIIDGGFYQVIHRDYSYDTFKSKFLAVFGYEHVADSNPESTDAAKKCYAFITANEEVYPLYNDNEYYIMTESGKTFSNLSLKK